MPSALLSRYFRSQAMFQELDSCTLKQARQVPMIDAWLTLPVEQPGPMKADLREILAESHQQGSLRISW